MATLPKTLHVPPDSELSRALGEAATTGDPVLIDTGETLFTIVVEAPLQKDHSVASRDRPSPERVARSIEGIRQAAGSWAEIDAEAFKAYIRERRRSSSRPQVQIDAETGQWRLVNAET